MKLHRVKHIPTGLYYQPGKTNLSEKGKVYHNNQDCLMTGYGHHLTISVLKNSKIFKKYTELFKGWKDKSAAAIIGQFDFSEFEREEIKTE